MLKQDQYNNSKFVVVGLNGLILTSTGNKTWNAIPTGISQSLYTVIFAYNKYVTVGDRGIILTSGDASKWVINISNNYRLYGVTYGNNLFAAVGDSCKILTSLDGTIWMRPNQPQVERYLYSVVYHEKKQFVTSGIMAQEFLF
jgi:photosystem II stability/assembly factor-like uncharacterized protein